MSAAAGQGGPDLVATLMLLALGAGVFAFAAWRHGRPPEPFSNPRWISWIVVLLVAATWCLVMLVHLVNLLGVETGRQ